MRNSTSLLWISLFIVQCSQTPATEAPAHIVVLDEIPAHIQSLENLTAFPGDAKPLYSMSLTPVQTYGEGSEFNASDILDAVEDDQGRVIVHMYSDSSAARTIHVYNADGSLHATLGRQGDKPDEYSNAMDLHAKNGKIYFNDFYGKRLHQYSTTDYSLESTIPADHWSIGEGSSLSGAYSRSDGRFLISFTNDADDARIGQLETRHQVMDADGKPVQAEPLVFPSVYRVKEMQSENIVLPITFLGLTVTSLASNDELQTMWTRDFLIKTYDADGNYKSAIYYPIQSAYPFDLDEYLTQAVYSPTAEEIIAALSTNGGLPETIEVVEQLMVDDENNIWVAIPADAQRESVEWWVLSASGELLAKMELPKKQRILDIRNGYLYSQQTNQESGTEVVVKYRMEMTPS